MDVRTVSPPSTGWKYKKVYASLMVHELVSGTVHHYPFYASCFIGAHAASDLILYLPVDHGLSVDKKIKFNNHTTGQPGMPAPLIIGTTYYVRDPQSTTIKVAAAPGGAAIDITSGGDVYTEIECGADYRLPEGKAGDYIGIKDYQGKATFYTPALLHCPLTGGASQYINAVGTTKIELGIDFDYWGFYCMGPGAWIQMRVNT